VRIFVFVRHAESVANVAHVLNSDPSRPAALTSRGRRQARRLGAQIANLEIDLAFSSRFQRTRETAQIALRGRDVPLLAEPGLDEIRAGVFDGTPIAAYWAWKEQHTANEPLPEGESLDEAVRRYVDSLQRLLARTEASTLIVGHELALRYIATAAAGPARARSSDVAVAHAVPFLFDEKAVRRAVACLDALTLQAPDQSADAA
jgi:broad specificity phosphatase PhoE